MVVKQIEAEGERRQGDRSQKTLSPFAAEPKMLMDSWTREGVYAIEGNEQPAPGWKRCSDELTTIAMPATICSN